MIIFTCVGTSILVIFYVFAIFVIFCMFNYFARYPYEMFGMSVNGFIGVFGFVLYSLNITYAGDAKTVDLIVSENNCVVNCVGRHSDVIDTCTQHA